MNKSNQREFNRFSRVNSKYSRGVFDLSDYMRKKPSKSILKINNEDLHNINKRKSKVSFNLKSDVIDKSQDYKQQIDSLLRYLYIYVNT